ncbi:hypothetical protein CEE44_03085 [Candidatus Woesearchaeota archaeon B3_Woes]|nr:MAG: hypothetical protein CEE44_03085 [Candidatus Woesearchaeota archaeon B3_Woes]
MNDWEKSIEDGKVLKISLNQERAKSLMISSLKLLNIIEKIKLDKENGFFILTNYYDIILESLHALLYKKGYQSLDHLSIGYYIKDVLDNQEFFNIFDKYRKTRNKILYYGRNIDPETAQQGIKDLKRLYQFVKKLLE